MTNEAPAQNGIEFISGFTNILLVAPHGHHLDDENTGTLTRLAAEKNGCYAIINEVYRKPKKPNDDVTADKQNKRVNLNRKNQVTTHLKKEFLEPLIKYKDEILKKFGNVLLLWIHGADDANMPKDTKVIVGYGQGETDKRHTVETNTIDSIIKGLKANSLTAIKADPNKNRFCARDINNMNQYFRFEGESLHTVQSVQLEFRKQDCRDTEKNIGDTAYNLIKAISTLLPAVVEAKPVMDDADDEKVKKAYEHLKDIFVKHFQNAMLECGQYLIKTFYNGYYELAQEKKFTSNKSMAKLIKRIQQEAKEKGDVPSRTWLYDAVNLAIDNYLYQQKKLPSAYGQLGHSHKVNLTSAPDKVKSSLVEETIREKYTVAKLRERIREEKDKLNPEFVSLKEAMSIKKLGKLKPKQLKALKTKTEGLVKKVQDEAKLYQGNLALIEQVLEKK